MQARGGVQHKWAPPLTADPPSRVTSRVTKRPGTADTARGAADSIGGAADVEEPMAPSGQRTPGTVQRTRAGFVAIWPYRDLDGKRRHRRRTFRREEMAWQHLRQLAADRRELGDDLARQLRTRRAAERLEAIAQDLTARDVAVLDDVLQELPVTLSEALEPPLDTSDVADVVRRFESACSQIRDSLHRALYAEHLLADAAFEADCRVGDAMEGLMSKSLEHCDDLTSPHVYCLWGDDPTQPLYVGKSLNVISRLAAHFEVKERLSLIRRVSLVACPTKEAMDRTEVRLIRRYQPRWNTLGVMPQPKEV